MTTKRKKIKRKNNTAVLIDELLEKHEESSSVVYENFKSIHSLIDAPSSTGAPDCRFLQLLCLEKKPKKIIEVGTWVGSTAYAMAFATKNMGTVIHTCDMVNGFTDEAGGDMFRRENCEEANRISTNPDTWSSDFLKNKELLDGADFIFDDACISLDDCRAIYGLASDEFYFVTHDYYDHEGEHQKGFTSIQDMMMVISENNGIFELYKPEKEWYFPGYKSVEDGQFGINSCSALLRCNKKKK